MKKFISILLLILILTFTLSNVVLANPTEAMKGFESGANSATLNNIGSRIYGIILVVGSAVALGTLAIMAIRFMTAAPEEKAEIKKNLVGFTVGVLILLCVVTILGIFQSIGQSISNPGTYV